MMHGAKVLRDWRREQATPLSPPSQWRAEPDWKEDVGGMRLGDNAEAHRKALQTLFSKPSRIDDPHWLQPPEHNPVCSSALPPLRRGDR